MVVFEERPGNFCKQFEQLDGFFTSSYIFASKFVHGKDVLDSGCGTGYGANFLANAGAKSVIGIDVDKKIIKKCKEHYKNTSNLKFEICSPVLLNFSDECFDVVVSFEVLEHIKNYTCYLKEIYRVLRKGGVLMLSTPNKEIYSPGLDNPIITCHIKEFYPNELYGLLHTYFSKVRMYGKHILNSQFIEEHKRFQASWNFAVIRALAKINFVRHAGKHIPYLLRQYFSGKPKVLKANDVKITKRDIERAYSLLVVCNK